MKVIVLWLALGIVSLAAFGQTIGSSQFEVASVKPAKPGTPENPLLHTGTVQFVFPGGKFSAREVGIPYLLEWAYGIQPSQLAGGPSWLKTEVFDIAAQAGRNATESEIKHMVQALLVDHFGLKMHRDTKNLRAIVMSIDRGRSGLVPTQEEGPRLLRFEPKIGLDQKLSSVHVVGLRYTIADVADVFARQLERIVVDRTGLVGRFDFT